MTLWGNGKIGVIVLHYSDITITELEEHMASMSGKSYRLDSNSYIKLTKKGVASVLKNVIYTGMLMGNNSLELVIMKVPRKDIIVTGAITKDGRRYRVISHVWGTRYDQVLETVFDQNMNPAIKIMKLDSLTGASGSSDVTLLDGEDTISFV